MDVFISWSGPQSKQVAEALRRYLPLIINAIHPWFSSADIDAGARWASDVAGKLQQSKVGIICLTPTNLESIWIHFEAGALAKTLESTFVCPYLVGVEPSDLTGPLTQFQAKRANEEDTRRLIETLNTALGENALKTDQLAEAFGTYWPKFKQALDAVQQDQAPTHKRSEREMLEELLELARSQARDTPPRVRPTVRSTMEEIVRDCIAHGLQINLVRTGDVDTVEIIEKESGAVLHKLNVPHGTSTDKLGALLSSYGHRLSEKPPSETELET